MISIIIPVYNGKKHIERCLSSILQQTHTDIEVIIVDDGSTDKSYQKCLEYRKYDNRIRLYQNAVNQGVSRTRNFGISKATGDYICFIDIDDKLYTLDALRLLHHPSYDLICGNFELTKDGELIKDKFVLCAEAIHLNRQDFLEKTYEYLICPRGNNNLYSTVWSKLYKTSIIKENNIRFCENVTKDEDVAFCIEFAMYTSKCLLIPDIVYAFAQEGDQDKQTRYDKGKGNMVFNMVSVFKKAEQFLTQAGVSVDKQNSLMVNFMNYYLKRYLYYKGLLDLL